MERVFQIGEIASFFGIPTSTLRFWEDSGVLVPKRNSENQYRVYTVPDLMTISDILFYKSLGNPLNQIRDMEQMGLQSHQDICIQQMEKGVGAISRYPLGKARQQIYRMSDEERDHIGLSQ